MGAVMATELANPAAPDRGSGMPNQRLARLRRARVICNKQIVRLESLLAYQRTRRDAIEADIQAIAPELWLPPATRKRDPIFKRGEMPRLALQVLREAGEPLAVSVIARRVLQAKGIELPTMAVQRRTRAGCGWIFLRAGQARGGADRRGGEFGEAGVGDEG